MIRCGSCKDRHPSVQDVKDCYAEMEYYGEITRSELAAEARNERWFEERGDWGAAPIGD